LPAKELAARRYGHGVSEFDKLGALVGSQPLLTKAPDFLFRGALARLELNVGLDRLPALAVWYAGDSGQLESIGAWSGETAVEFPATEILYAALTWDDPDVEMRQLSLEDVVEQLAYDFLSDTHGGWENNDGAWGEFCFDAAARCIHLEFNERYTSSELYTHDF